MQERKMIILSAPSGSGKSTIIHYLLQKGFPLEFSISATTRPPRGTEQNGVEYYFYSVEEFKKKIQNGEFVEYEEVYENRFYGMLKAECERIWSKGNVIVFDVDFNRNPPATSTSNTITLPLLQIRSHSAFNVP